MIIDVDEDGYVVSWGETGKENKATIDELIAVYEKQKKGYWALYPYEAGPLDMYGFSCSACGAITPTSVSKYKYCPNCGARMELAKGDRWE